MSKETFFLSIVFAASLAASTVVAFGHTDGTYHNHPGEVNILNGPVCNDDQDVLALFAKWAKTDVYETKKLYDKLNKEGKCFFLTMDKGATAIFVEEIISGIFDDVNGEPTNIVVWKISPRNNKNVFDYVLSIENIVGERS